MTDLLGALSYLHSRGIAHRDVKLENLLCANTTWPLNVKLADFGFANYVSKTDEPMLSSFVGTPYYIAPEMLRGSPHGQAVDIWASGVVMYILLSGKFPFGGKNESEYYQRVLTKEAYFPSEDWNDVSEDAKNLVRGMLCKDPKKRLTADECLKHSWLKRSGVVIDAVNVDGDVFPSDPMSSAFSDPDPHAINMLPPIHIRAMSDADAEMPACESVGRAPTPPSSNKTRFRTSEKQHFLRSPGVFKDNREKKGRWRYLGMLNHSISSPTEEMLATRTQADLAPRRPDTESRDGMVETAASFDEILPDSPDEPTMYRRPSLIRRLLSSGKLSLDRYDCRFPSFRGSVEEHADEASATPRKTLSLFSKDGPLRRSFHRSGENRPGDDGINFADANAQRLPPKIARERQRQQRQAAALRRASRPGNGLFSHRKSATQQHILQQQQSAGYHSSPRLQTPVHPLSSIPTPPGQRGPIPGPGLIGSTLMKRRMTANTGSYTGGTHVGIPDESTFGAYQHSSTMLHGDDGSVRRTVSADVAPMSHFTNTDYISPQLVTGRL